MERECNEEELRGAAAVGRLERLFCLLAQAIIMRSWVVRNHLDDDDDDDGGTSAGASVVNNNRGCQCPASGRRRRDRKRVLLTLLFFFWVFCQNLVVTGAQEFSTSGDVDQQDVEDGRLQMLAPSPCLFSGGNQAGGVRGLLSLAQPHMRAPPSMKIHTSLKISRWKLAERYPRLKFSKQMPSWLLEEGRMDEPAGLLGTAAEWAGPSSSSSSHSAIGKLETDLITMCYLIEVQCYEGRVIAINFSNRALRGPIPFSFSLLTGLQALNLSHNSFSGGIPSWLGLLPNLTSLDLSFNCLSGSIPASIGSLANLGVLDLRGNQLSGSIPAKLLAIKSLKGISLSGNNISGEIPELCGMAGVRYISFSFNNLHGIIPPNVGCLQSLEFLSLAHNNLSGVIPIQLTGLQLLKVLDLQNNSLTGGIPFQFGNLRLLKVLRLQRNSLSGSIPLSLGMISSLLVLRLSNNLLNGSIPNSLGMLSSLQVLDLSNNQFSGSLPDELSQLTKLKALYVNHTFISGSIPMSLGNLESLKILSLSSNNLTGLIPSSLGNLGLLLFLDLQSNNLTGFLPPSLCNCILLRFLLLSFNSLQGEIPVCFTRFSWLKVVAMGKNSLSGSLPAWGRTSPFLEEIILPSNNFCGSIPLEWGQLQFLHLIALSFNNLTGSIPESLAHCRWLQQLWLDHNAWTGNLGAWLGNLPNLVALSVANNKLEGQLPSSLANCQYLETVYLGSNAFNGEIPAELGQLPNLVVLSLSFNNLSGSIPLQLGDLALLEGLDLAGNVLSGNLPSQLARLISLRFLLLGQNNFTGTFPTWISQLTKLQALDLSFNSLSGEIPMGLANVTYFQSQDSLLTPQPASPETITNWALDMMYIGASRGQTYLLLGGNHFSGTLPADFGELKNLWVLDVHDNKLVGEIPASLGGAEALCYLDLSQNSFQGVIPAELESLSFLSFFNVSQNQLTGPIPEQGQFDTFGPDSFSKNLGLCGVPVGRTCGSPMSPPSAQLMNISDGNGHRSAFSKHRGQLRTGALACIVLATGMGTWAVLGLLCWWELSRRRKILTRLLAVHDLVTHEWPTPKDALSINVAMFETLLPKLTLGDLMEATNNFSIENIIGDGGFGTVYKATFKDNRVVAVKRLMGDKTEGEREFLAEMETLGKVKHANIVQLLGYCTFGSDRVLVYEYKCNGNLDLWLHRNALICAGRTGLNWSTRLKIAQGAARGLVFLHHVCVPHVIHRDIKASNILLDADFNAFIADFGLARLISAYDSHLSTQFAGTVGYIPPEYGQCALASTKGDVYSFGIVLLEILTGKRPTDRFFTDKEDSDLISWVRHSVLQSKILEILDPELILELDAELRDHVDRLVGGVDSYVHPHFSPGSSPASSPGRSPLFSPDVHPVHFSPSFAAAAAPGANLSCMEMRGGGHVRLPPRFSLGLSSVSSPASNARRSSFGYSPMSGFDGIPEFECTFRECGMKQELVRVLGLAVWCTEDMRSKRPSMLQISRLLDTIGTQRL